MGGICKSGSEGRKKENKEKLNISSENTNNNYMNNQINKNNNISGSTLENSNIMDTNIKKPILKKYNAKNMDSVNSMLSNDSSAGLEIITNEGIIDNEFIEDNITNNDLKNYLKKESKDSNKKPLTESFSFFEKNNKLQYFEDKKAKTTVKSGKLKYPKMLIPNPKKKILNNSSKMTISLNESNSASKALYLHIPKNDNKPISDLENITENNL